MNVLQIIDKIWTSIEMMILSVTTILMSILLMGNAVSRFAFNHSWAFTEEVGQIALVVMTFGGISYAARHAKHIKMDGLFEAFPERIQKLLSIFISFVTAGVMLFVAYLSLQYVLYVHELGEVTTVLRIPVYITMSIVPIGFFLAFIRYFVDFVVISFVKN